MVQNFPLETPFKSNLSEAVAKLNIHNSCCTNHPLTFQ